MYTQEERQKAVELYLELGSYTPFLNSSHIIQAELPEHGTTTGSFSVSILFNDDGKKIIVWYCHRGPQHEQIVRM